MSRWAHALYKTAKNGRAWGGVAVAGLTFFLGYQLADTQYLSSDAEMLHVWLAVGVAILSLLFSDRRHQRSSRSIAFWVVLSVLSIVWSLSPAASVRASLWHVVYLSVFLAGLVWPRLTLGAIVSVHLVAIVQGVDLLIVTGSVDFRGVWYQQNAQGGQLLLIAPLLAAWSFAATRWSPYVAFLLGIILFLSGLTYSTASQILVVAGVIAVLWYQRRAFRTAAVSQKAAVGLLLSAGLLVGWFLTQPTQAEVFGVSLGARASPETAPIKDPSGTLIARLRIIDDVGRRALQELPLGTGVGTLPHLYSSLQTHPEIETVDAHNYYLQTLLTMGIFGVSLFVWLVFAGLKSAYEARQWGLMVATFLFAGYLAFDIVAYYPGIMLLFLGTLGAAHGLRAEQTLPRCRAASQDVTSTDRVVPNRIARLRQRWVGVMGFAVLIPVWAIWLQPCDTITCFAKRKFGDRETTRAVWRQLDANEQLIWSHVGLALNPDSLYYERLRADTYVTLGEDVRALEHYRAIAQKFPAADLQIYRQWRDAALRAGSMSEALEAIYASYDVYGETLLLTGF